jgi:hypothetical protein
LYDNFSGITEPIAGIRYWQIKTEPALTYPIQVIVEFYENNSGTMGPLVNSWNMYLSPSFTTVDGFDVIDITLPSPVNLSNGWVGINSNDARIPTGSGYTGWLSTSLGDNYIKYSPDLTNYYTETTNLSFCLTGGSTSTIPISNWALFIGIGLILVFAIVRFRKLV